MTKKISDKVVPLNKRAAKVIELSLEESLANEFIHVLKKDNNVAILLDMEVKGTFFFILVKMRSLTVTSINNNSVFQPHETTKCKEYPIISIIQIGETPNKLPVMIQQLTEVKCPITYINNIYTLRESIESFNN